MANGEISVNVNVEAHMHKTLLELAKIYREKHGVCIRYVEFNWLGPRFGESAPSVLLGVEVKTQAGRE